MANILKTVKSSGGDYTSLAGLEAGEQQNLTDNGGDTFEGVCYSLDDVTAVTFNTWTTGAANYIYIHTDPTARHAGVWDGDKYNLVMNNGSAILLYEEYCRFDGLQIGATAGADWTGISVSSVGAANETRISNCIFKGQGGTSYIDQGIRVNDADAVANIWNCIIYDGSAKVATGPAGINVNASTTVNIYSCAIIDSRYGILSTAGTVTAKNCYCGNSTVADYSGTISMTTCASEDATGSAGLQGIAVDADTFVNVSAGTEDFHLAADGLSPLEATGTDTTGDAAPMNFTTDIDGDLRQTAAWDIGADGIPSAAGPQTITVDDGIATAEAFGTHQLNFTLYPSAIAGAEAFGTHQLNFTLYASAIETAETFGTSQLNFTVYPSAIAGSEAFGTAQLNFTLYPTAIGSSEAFGTLTITVAGQVKTYTGIFMFQNMNL